MSGPLLPGTVPLPEPGKSRTTCPLLPATQPDAQQVNVTFSASLLAFSPAFSKKIAFAHCGPAWGKTSV